MRGLKQKDGFHITWYLTKEGWTQDPESNHAVYKVFTVQKADSHILRKRRPTVHERIEVVKKADKEAVSYLTKAFGQKPGYHPKVHAMVLDVPFDDNQKVKALGAKWEPELKFWYVPKDAVIENGVKLKEWAVKRSKIRKLP